MPTSDRRFLFAFRMLMAWTFLYSASHQVFVTWSVSGFLLHTKTFHFLYAPLAGPTTAPILTFLVGYGHLLIGLSLLFGLFTRLGAAFGVAILMTYWTAHMDFPYIDDVNFFIVDYHMVYSTALLFLIAHNAGQVFGLDGVIANWPVVRQNGLLRWAAGSPALA